MLRDITLGQYYPADSVIHKLDPRVKLFATFIYIISLFCFKGIAALLVATVFLIFCIRTSKVPFKFMVKGLKAIVVLMLITAAFNLFLTPGTPIVKFWIFKITAEGAQNAILMAIRLTYLIPELLQLVDNGRIAPTPAVELSYLPEKAQTCLLEEMRRNDCTPSLSQAIRMKKLYQTGSLSPEDISTIMQEEKANQQEKVSFKTGDLRKFFPKSYSAAQMQETILKLLSEYQRKRQRAAER